MLSQLSRIIISRTTILILTFVGAFISANAQKADIKISLKAKDALSKREMNCRFKVYSAKDTTYIKEATGYSTEEGATVYISNPPTKLLLKVVAREEKFDEDGNYAGSVESTQYEPKWVELDVSDNRKEYTVPPVFLSKLKIKKLDEVTVTASKVMFYYKGDTLVYNADAFVLAEGSMLDALIEQLPGVKLNSNGVITVDGRVMDRLLLNGKDLFNGNNELMLENLAAYTVKDIRVYKLQGYDSKLMDENAGDSKDVMDVRLKRQYSMGWVVNSDIGYGSHDRYLAKLFGMWFSDNVSTTLYGGANNLSDSSKPGRSDGSWSRERMGDGLKNRQYGGLTYNAQGQSDKWLVQGDVDVVHEDEDIMQRTTKQNYLPGGDTYNYLHNKSTMHNFKMSSEHAAKIDVSNQAYVIIEPKLEYATGKNRTSIIDQTSHKELTEISGERTKSVYEGGVIGTDGLINQVIQESLDRSSHMSTGINVRSSMNVKSTGTKGMLSFSAGTGINRHRANLFRTYDITYGGNAIEDYAESQYIHNSPNRLSETNAKVEYTLFSSGKKKWRIPMEYEFKNIEEHMVSDFFDFGKLAEKYPLGVLPSISEYAPTLDADRSTDRMERDTGHTLKFGASTSGNETFSINIGSHKLSIHMDAWMAFTISDRHFNYHHGINDNRISRLGVLPDANVKFSFFDMVTKDKSILTKWRGNLTLNISTIKAPMEYMVDMPVTDPLNIYHGNVNLANSQLYKMSLNMSRPTNNRGQQTFSFNYANHHNAAARGYVYDLTNGVRTFKAYNVNGNFNTEASYSLFTPFSQSSHFDFKATTTGRYGHNVDFIGSNSPELSILPERRTVKTINILQSFETNFKTGQHRITSYIAGQCNRYRSRDAGFEDFTSWTGRFGASGVLNLPRNWGVSTDLTLYMRRGFTDRRLNTQDVVWNARVTKSLLKGSVVVAVDGYDLLRQLTNITYTINAQARTETVSNVIPAYVLVHVQWRWNKQPKR